MKFIKFSITTIALLCLSAGASAQQTSTGPAAGAPTATLRKGKIALINSAAFQSEIAEYKAKIEAINRQFEPRTKDLQSLVDRIAALENTLKTQGQVLTPANVAERTEQLEAMKREHQRKQEDLQIEGRRALEQAITPLNQKLGKFLQDYTAKRGITVIIDVANEGEANFLVWADPRIIITRDFINEYNKAHPVAPAPASPASPQKP
jgi:Skp family chaperone for outer membrane proteins